MSDERELHVSPSAPLNGWRLFRVGRDERGPVLTAAMYHDPDPPVWPERVQKATCTEGHEAPSADCRCGIYAVVPGTLDSLPGYLRDTAAVRAPWAYAEIACSGCVFVDRRGIRAQHAQLLQLALAWDSWPAAAAATADALALRRRYGVPVAELEAVPDWVTGNLRSQGPPLDDAALDLDELDLPWPE